MDSHPVQYLGYCMVCNSFNPSRLFNPMHRKLTPNKDRPAIRLTPFLFFFLSAFQLPKKTKSCLSSDLSLPKIRKPSHTIAQSPWLQLADTASHTSTTSGVPIRSGFLLSIKLDDLLWV